MLARSGVVEEDCAVSARRKDLRIGSANADRPEEGTLVYKERGANDPTYRAV